ncbi:hypothetical protein ASG86_10110 [Arthrobacter sp. Soil764]|nr:hypothetical protein ASG86_10110 [Arthrobacter sp. Soil764]
MGRAGRTARPCMTAMQPRLANKASMTRVARVELLAVEGRVSSRMPGANLQLWGYVYVPLDKHPSLSLLDTLRIKFGRIDSSHAPNTANDRAGSARAICGMRVRVILAKTGARLAPLMA